MLIKDNFTKQKYQMSNTSSPASDKTKSVSNIACSNSENNLTSGRNGSSSRTVVRNSSRNNTRTQSNARLSNGGRSTKGRPVGRPKKGKKGKKDNDDTFVLHNSRLTLRRKRALQAVKDYEEQLDAEERGDEKERLASEKKVSSLRLRDKETSVQRSNSSSTGTRVITNI